MNARPQTVERPSPNHDARTDGQPVDMLLLHYTGMPTAQEALDRLCDPDAKVSAHYVIDEDGTLHCLVPEERRAWHAGVARWAGATDINARSVGIELVNPGHDWGYRTFPPAQMHRLAELARDILARHSIPPRRVLGHSDVAPTRKQDPGELFDWAWLAAQGIGLWPGDPPPLEALPPDGQLRAQLTAFGYGLEEVPLEAVVAAFQRHFRPDSVTGRFDGATAARLAALLHLVDLPGASPYL